LQVVGASRVAAGHGFVAFAAFDKIIASDDRRKARELNSAEAPQRVVNKGVIGKFVVVDNAAHAGVSHIPFEDPGVPFNIVVADGRRV